MQRTKYEVLEEALKAKSEKDRMDRVIAVRALEGWAKALAAYLSAPADQLHFLPRTVPALGSERQTLERAAEREKDGFYVIIFRLFIGHHSPSMEEYQGSLAAKHVGDGRVALRLGGQVTLDGGDGTRFDQACEALFEQIRAVLLKDD